MGRIVLPWLGWWLVLAGLYLLLADTVVAPELVIGAFAAAVGATAATLVRRRRRPFRPRGHWLLAAVRSAPRVVTDLLPLARVLVTRGILRRDPGAQFVELPLEGADDAADRAWAAAVGTLGPNTVVVNVDRERGVVIVHQLLRTARLP